MPRFYRDYKVDGIYHTMVLEKRFYPVVDRFDEFEFYFASFHDDGDKDLEFYPGSSYETFDNPSTSTLP